MDPNSRVMQELFTGLWMMEPNRLREFFSRAASIRADAFAGIEIATEAAKLVISGKTAIIPISGVLLKSVPDWVKYWGFNATGYDDIRRMTAQALADTQVSDIELHVSSPGGMVAGCIETAQAILAARDSKPVTAHVEDIGASAAYWLASQAETVTAGQSCEVGSIGVYAVMVDWSKMYQELGVEVHVIRSGLHKGQGVPGAPISEEYLKVEQEIIDQMADQFVDGVMTGRGMDRDAVAKLATGRVWLGPEAKTLGLIDTVRAPQQTQKTSKKGNAMDSATKTPENETTQPIDTDAIAQEARDTERKRCADLRQAFSKDPAFALEAIDAGWSVQEAKGIAYDRYKAKENEKPKTSGVEPIEQSGGGGQDSGTGFMEQARERSRERKITMTEAMREIQAKNPQAYDSFREQQSQRRTSISGQAQRISR